MVKNTLKIIACTVWMLLPLSLRGQQTIFGNGNLRESAISVSEELPYAVVVYDFAERYLTELGKLTKEEQRSRMERDDVRILQGGLERLSLLNDSSLIIFSERENCYCISLFNGDYPLVELAFPASCQLLLGKNLKELEMDFLDGLLSYVYKPVLSDTLRKENLTTLGGNFYLLQGDSYQIEDINDNCYYVIADGGKPELLFSMEHPAESVFNLLLSEELAEDIRLSLTVRKYGLKKQQIDLPLSQWISYLRSKGCRLYVGIESLETKAVKATFFAVNTVLKYNHVMNVTIPYTLLNNKEGSVRGDVNLFIPTHNIAALFDELNWVEPPTKKQIQIIE